jgi:hypothetical protein
MELGKIVSDSITELSRHTKYSVNETLEFRAMFMKVLQPSGLYPASSYWVFTTGEGHGVRGGKSTDP